MGEANYTGAALEKALASGELHDQSTTLTGMVKASDTKAHVSFSLWGCDSWVDIPTSMIESAERAGTRPCSGHSHPVMKIKLKAPSSAEGQILLALLNQGSGGESPNAALSAGFPYSAGVPYTEPSTPFPGGTLHGAIPLANDGRELKCFGGTTPCGNGRCNYQCCRVGPFWWCWITGPAVVWS